MFHNNTGTLDVTVFINILILLIFLQKTSLATSSVCIRGKIASLDCYDPLIPMEYPDFYVEVEFSPTSVFKKDFYIKIGSYKPSSKRQSRVHQRYISRLGYQTTGQLLISDIGLRDEGGYRCISHVFGRPTPAPVLTNVVVYVAPVVEVKKLNDPLVVGDSVIDAAICSAHDGRPPARTMWKTDRLVKFSQTSGNISNGVLTTVKTTMHIEPSKFYNRQSFFCEIKHPAFSEDAIITVILNVTYPPDVPRISVDKDGQELSCSSRGNPPAKITWESRIGTSLKTHTGPTLTMLNTDDPSHYNDLYICTASNGISYDKSTNITTLDAISLAEESQQANMGLIIGAALGALVLLIVVISLYYCFVTKRGKKENALYEQQSALTHYQAEGYNTARSNMYRVNSTSTRGKYHSSTSSVLPSKERMHYDIDADSQSNGSDNDMGRHDVDLPVPCMSYASLYDQNSAGVGSKTSVNFRTQRNRPSSAQSSHRSFQIRKPLIHSPLAPIPHQSKRVDRHSSDFYNSEEGSGSDHSRGEYHKKSHHSLRHPKYVEHPPQSSQRRTCTYPRNLSQYSEISRPPRSNNKWDSEIDAT